MRLVNADDLDFFFCETVEECAFELGNAPTIDALPVVHAEWVTETIDKNERKTCVSCSKCEAFFTLDLFDYGLCYNYCPSCGAKMDGGDNDGL